MAACYPTPFLAFSVLPRLNFPEIRSAADNVQWYWLDVPQRITRGSAGLFNYSTTQTRPSVTPSREQTITQKYRRTHVLDSNCFVFVFLLLPFLRVPKWTVSIFKSGSSWRIFQFYRIFIPVGYTYYFLTYSTTAVLHRPSYLRMSPWPNFCHMFPQKHIPIYQVWTSYC